MHRVMVVLFMSAAAEARFAQRFLNINLCAVPQVAASREAATVTESAWSSSQEQ
jgi:hypothetical protein